MEQNSSVPCPSPLDITFFVQTSRLPAAIMPKALPQALEGHCACTQQTGCTGKFTPLGAALNETEGVGI